MPTPEEVRAAFVGLTGGEPIQEEAARLVRDLTDPPALEAWAASGDALRELAAKVWLGALRGELPDYNDNRFVAPALVKEPLAPWIAAFGLWAVGGSTYPTQYWLKGMITAFGVERVAPALLALLDVAPRHPHRAHFIKSLQSGFHGGLITPRAARALTLGLLGGAQLRAACLSLLKLHAEVVTPLLDRALVQADKVTRRGLEAALAELRPVSAPASGGRMEQPTSVQDDPPGLAGARRAVGRGDFASALATLLDEWRQTRDPATANVIDAIGDRLPRSPLRARSKVDEQRLFLELAAQDRPEDLGVLLATPWPPAQWKLAQERVEALAKRRPDPRVAAGLMRLTKPKLYDSWGSYPFWTTLFTTVLELGDRRAAADLETLAQEASKTGVYYVDTTVGRALAALLDKRSVSDSIAHHPVVAPSDPESLSAMRESLTGAPSENRSGEELLSQIHREPDNDDARRVYADWLVEQGDPRGELIHLQCERAAGRGTGAMARREGQLLKEHKKSWLDGLERLARNEHIELERGFVASIALGPDRAPLGATVELPIWSLIREVAFLGPNARYLRAESLLAWLTGARLVSLRSLHGLSLRALVALAASPAVPALEVVGLHGHPETSDSSARIWTKVDGPGVARVRCVSVAATEYYHPQPHQWLHEMPIWPRLERVELAGALGQSLQVIMSWLAQRATSTLHEARVFGTDTEWSGKSTGWDLRFTRDAHSRLSILRAQWRANCHGSALYELARALGSLEAGSLTAVRVDKGVRLESDAAAQREVDAALTRLGITHADLYWDTSH